MKKGKERVFSAHGMTIYHQNFPKKQLKQHSHPEAHLFIPLEGYFEVEVNNIVHKVSAGQMMFVGASVEHSFKAKGEAGERLILQIEKFKFKSSVSILPLHHLIRDLALNIFFYAEEAYLVSMIKLILEVLNASLNKERTDAPRKLFLTQEKILSSHHSQFLNVMNVMEDNPEYSLTEVAAESGLSIRTLSRLCREETGFSPNELHTFYRIQKAIKLIYEANLGLTAIAFECGYSSLSQFIGNFKRWTGAKPSEFKPFQ